MRVNMIGSGMSGNRGRATASTSCRTTRAGKIVGANYRHPQPSCSSWGRPGRVGRGRHRLPRRCANRYGFGGEGRGSPLPISVKWAGFRRALESRVRPAPARLLRRDGWSRSSWACCSPCSSPRWHKYVPSPTRRRARHAHPGAISDHADGAGWRPPAGCGRSAHPRVKRTYSTPLAFRLHRRRSGFLVLAFSPSAAIFGLRAVKKTFLAVPFRGRC